MSVGLIPWTPDLIPGFLAYRFSYFGFVIQVFVSGQTKLAALWSNFRRSFDFIWFAFVIPLPVAVFSRVNPNNGLCMEMWPDDAWQLVYTASLMALQYFIPLAILTACYSTICYVIWIKKPPGEAENARDRRLALSKRKVSARNRELCIVEKINEQISNNSRILSFRIRITTKTTVAAATISIIVITTRTMFTVLSSMAKPLQKFTRVT